MSGKSKVLVFSGSDLLTRMVPTFCPLTIWAISLEFCRKPYILEADDFLGACYRKAMSPKKAMDFTFSQSCGFPSIPGIAPGVAPRILVFVLLKSWDAIPRMEIRIPRMEFRIPRAAPRIPRNSPRAPRMAFSLRECFS